MAVTIKIKTAASSGVTPTTSALEYGELAINQYTGVLYYKHYDATTPVIKAIGSIATVEGAVLITGNQTIAGAKTFSGLATSTTTLVTNLNADRLDSQEGSFYQDAANLTTGTVASARISGSYTGITGVSALTAGSIASGFGTIDIGTNTLSAGKTTLATGTIITSQPAIDVTQTWNASGVTFTGLKQNIIDTASASGSLLLDLQAGGVSKFSVTKTGNVGIGTTVVPTQKLDLNGSLRISSSGAYSDPSDNAGFINYDTFGGILTLSARSNGGNTFIAVRTSNSGSGSEKMRITNDGNVGIGVTSPAYKLDVTGTGRFTSTLLVTGATTLSSTLAVTGATTLSSTLAVAGALTTTVGGGAGTGTQTMATQAYLNSRGMNLVANGIGALTNNYNFIGFVFDQTDTFTGKGSFKAAHGVVASTVLSDEFIAIDIGKTYLLTLYAKTTQFTSLSTLYAGIAMFDIDNFSISSYNIMRQSGTDTRLRSPLAVNDMVVVVEPPQTSWQPTSTAANNHLRSIIIWGYRNSFLYTYPDYTYSRFWITDSYFSTGVVCQLVLTVYGAGYTPGTYALGFSGGSGTGAAGSYIVDSSARVVAVYMTTEGSGYTSAPTVSFPTSGPGTGATATARITSNATGGTVEYLVKGASGSGFTGTTGTIAFSGGGATTQATGHVTINSGTVDRIILTSQGSGYTSNPTVTITAGGTGATAYATIGTGIDATNNRIYLKTPFSSSFQNPVNSGVWPIGTALSNGSSDSAYKYIAAAGVTVPTAWTKFTGKIGGIDTSGLDINYSLFRPGTATVKILFLPNHNSITNCVISAAVLTAGFGYTSIPALTFGTTGSLTATGSAVMRVVSATIASGGTGYAVGNIISVSTGTGTAATFQVATVSAGVVATITALNTGGAYTVLPTLSAVATTANPAGGTGLTLNLSMGIASVTILTSGSGYSSGAPLLTSAASAGVTATLSCTIGNNIQNYSTISFTEVSDRNVAVFQPTTTTEVGLAVKLLSSQTANTQEWQNSSGIVLASIGTSGQFLAGNTGSAAFPGIAFTGDTNTGVYNSAPGTLQLVTGGVARVTIDSAGNLNGPAGAHFNIVPAATYSLVLNGNVGILGVGTEASPTTLSINAPNSTTAGDSRIILSQSTSAGDFQLLYAGTDSRTDSRTSNNAYIEQTQAINIRTKNNGTAFNSEVLVGGGIFFSTNATNSLATERMRINTSGNVGIGTTAPAYKLDVTGTGRFTDTLLVEGAATFSSAAPQISLTNATSNWINWGTTGIAAPAFTTRSAGTKLLLYPGVSSSTLDYAIGVNTDQFWMSVMGTTSSFMWYAGNTTPAMTLTNNILNTISGYNVAGTVFCDASRNLTTGTINGQTISSAASFTGTVNVVTGIKINGAATAANYLRGDGINFISAALAAADLTGTVATARLASGTASATTFLRGDNTWAAPVGTVPVGTVLSWLKSFNGNTPQTLPTEFVECNGQALTTSPYTTSPYYSSNGTTIIIPNLNGATVNSVVGTKRFLRGSTVSGGTGGTEIHTHPITSTSTSICAGASDAVAVVTSVTSPTGSTTNNTLPSYYEVVWIMRVM